MNKNEVLKLLDFKVEKKEIYVHKPEVKIPSRFAIVRSDTNDILGVISGRYRVIEHTEVFNKPLTEFTKLYDIEGCHLVNKGSKVVVRLTSKQVTPILKDDYKFSINLINSYDGTTSFRLQIGLHNISKGFVSGMPGQSFIETRRIHTGVSDIVVKELVKETYEALDRYIPLYTSKMKEFANKPLKDISETTKVLELLGYGKNSMKNILSEHEVQDLAGLYVAITKFYSKKLEKATNVGQRYIDINTVTGNLFEGLETMYNKLSIPVAVK